MGRLNFSFREEEEIKPMYEPLEGETIVMGLEGFLPEGDVPMEIAEEQAELEEATAALEHAELLIQVADKQTNEVLKMDLQIATPDYKVGVVQPEWEDSEETKRARKEEAFEEMVVKKYGLDKKKESDELGERMVSLSKESYNISQEGFIDAIKNFFKAIGNFFKKIWEKIFGGGGSTSSSEKKIEKIDTSITEKVEKMESNIAKSKEEIADIIRNFEASVTPEATEEQEDSIMSYYDDYKKPEEGSNTEAKKDPESKSVSEAEKEAEIQEALKESDLPAEITEPLSKMEPKKRMVVVKRLIEEKTWLYDASFTKEHHHALALVGIFIHHKFNLKNAEKSTKAAAKNIRTLKKQIERICKIIKAADIRKFTEIMKMNDKEKISAANGEFSKFIDEKVTELIEEAKSDKVAEELGSESRELCVNIDYGYSMPFNHLDKHYLVLTKTTWKAGHRTDKDNSAPNRWKIQKTAYEDADIEIWETEKSQKAIHDFLTDLVKNKDKFMELLNSLSEAIAEVQDAFKVFKTVKKEIEEIENTAYEMSKIAVNSDEFREIGLSLTTDLFRDVSFLFEQFMLGINSSLNGALAGINECNKLVTVEPLSLKLNKIFHVPRYRDEYVESQELFRQVDEKLLASQPSILFGRRISNEGVLDGIKNFFSWLMETAKKWWDKFWNGNKMRREAADKEREEKSKQLKEYLEKLKKAPDDNMYLKGILDKPDQLARFSKAIAVLCVFDPEKSDWDVSKIEQGGRKVIERCEELTAVIDTYSTKFLDGVFEEIKKTYGDRSAQTPETVAKVLADAEATMLEITKLKGFTHKSLNIYESYTLVCPVQTYKHAVLSLAKDKRGEKDRFNWNTNVYYAEGKSLQEWLEDDQKNLDTLNDVLSKLASNPTKNEVLAKDLEKSLDALLNAYGAAQETSKKFNELIKNADTDSSQSEFDGVISHKMWDAKQTTEMNRISAACLKLHTEFMRKIWAILEDARYGIIELINLITGKKAGKGGLDPTTYKAAAADK